CSSPASMSWVPIAPSPSSTRVFSASSSVCVICPSSACPGRPQEPPLHCRLPACPSPRQREVNRLEHEAPLVESGLRVAVARRPDRRPGPRKNVVERTADERRVGADSINERLALPDVLAHEPVAILAGNGLTGLPANPIAAIIVVEDDNVVKRQ